MEINFDEIGSITDFEPVPEGTYVCRVVRVEEARSSRGDEMWNLRLEIDEGPHARRVVFDRLVFSPAAMKRVKLICQCLKVSTSGKRELTPEMLLGRLCRVNVLVRDYVDQEGESRSSNTVPFDGYAPVEDDGLPR